MTVTATQTDAPIVQRKKATKKKVIPSFHTHLTDDDELMTSQQVCKMLQISRSTLHSLSAHLLKVNVTSKSVRFSRKSVVDYLNRLNCLSDKVDV